MTVKTNKVEMFGGVCAGGTWETYIPWTVVETPPLFIRWRAIAEKSLFYVFELHSSTPDADDYCANYKYSHTEYDA